MAFLIGGANTLDDAYEIENSLRFNGSNSELEDTLGTPTNIKKFTISLWFKRSALYGDITTGQSLISCYRGAVSNPFGALNFGGNDHIEFFGFDDENTTVMNIQTNAGRFRDVAAWYHIVFAVDTTQGTASNRVKVYINGVQETSLATETYPAQNKELAWNQSSTVHYIGHYQYTNATWMNGYEAEFAFIDGSQLTASSFGETNSNGVWVPKEFKDDVTFGNNGYYLEFKQTGTSQNSSGIGADTSGNDRHFAVSGLAAINVTTDTPTNNFATLNNLNIRLGKGLTHSNGNLQVQTGTSSGTLGGYSTIAGLKSGKWYAEYKPTVVGTNATMRFGIESSDFTAADGLCNVAASAYASNGNKGRNATDTSHGNSYDDNDIIGVAVDLDNGAIYFSKNGTWQNSSDPESGSSKTGAAYTDILTILPDGGYMFAFNFSYNNSQQETVQANFGNPIFSISSGNSDGNGYGLFEYAVPSGYYALCTKNLAEYG